MRKLDSAHDLSRGEREYLRQQGVSLSAFDSMAPDEQHDWLDEMKNPSYENMRNWEQKEGKEWHAHRRDRHNNRNR